MLDETHVYVPSCQRYENIQGAICNLSQTFNLLTVGPRHVVLIIKALQMTEILMLGHF